MTLWNGWQRSRGVNGRVGMLGFSYLGEVQWLAARARPPHLVCIAPTASGALDGIFNYLGGAVVMGWAIPWLNLVSGRIYQGDNVTGTDWDQVFQHRPLLTMDEAFGRRIPFYRAFMEHPDWDPHWKKLHFDPEVYRSLDIPALHVTGWFDGDQPTAMHRWRGMTAHSPSANSSTCLPDRGLTTTPFWAERSSSETWTSLPIRWSTTKRFTSLF